MSVSYEKATVAYMRSVAATHGIKIPAKSKRADIVGLLQSKFPEGLPGPSQVKVVGNLVTLPISHLTHIEGPYGLSRLYRRDSEGNVVQVVYLFYDIHERIFVKPCERRGVSVGKYMNIVDFFQNLLLYAPAAITLFMETSPNSPWCQDGSVPADYQCYITDLITKFHQNFKVPDLKKHRLIPNDIRHTWPTLIKFKEAMEKEKQVSPKDFLHTIDEWDRILMSEMGVGAKMKACEPKVQEVLQTWKREQLQKPELVTRMAAFNEHIRKGTLSRVGNDMVWWGGPGSALLTIYMDLYTVASILSDDDMRNVFVYTGGFHTERYEELLVRAGLQLETKVLNSAEMVLDGQCVDLSAFRSFTLVSS